MLQRFAKIEKAQKILIEMYLSLNIKDKKFVDKYLFSDLLYLKGDTGGSYAAPLDFISQFKFKDLGVNYSQKITGLRSKKISFYISKFY